MSEPVMGSELYAACSEQRERKADAAPPTEAGDVGELVKRLVADIARCTTRAAILGCSVESMSHTVPIEDLKAAATTILAQQARIAELERDMASNLESYAGQAIALRAAWNKAERAEAELAKLKGHAEALLDASGYRDALWSRTSFIKAVEAYRAAFPKEG